jgi:hypothetical protein
MVAVVEGKGELGVEVVGVEVVGVLIMTLSAI